MNFTEAGGLGAETRSERRVWTSDGPFAAEQRFEFCLVRQLSRRFHLLLRAFAALPGNLFDLSRRRRTDLVTRPEPVELDCLERSLCELFQVTHYAKPLCELRRCRQRCKIVDEDDILAIQLKVGDAILFVSQDRGICIVVADLTAHRIHGSETPAKNGLAAFDFRHAVVAVGPGDRPDFGGRRCSG
jgi:hypothetical protein